MTNIIASGISMTFDQAEDQLTYPRIMSLYQYWNEHPPVHLLVAGYIGYKGSGESNTFTVNRGGDASELAGEFAVVSTDTDPLLSKFKYDPEKIFVFDKTNTVH